MSAPPCGTAENLCGMANLRENPVLYQGTASANLRSSPISYQGTTSANQPLKSSFGIRARLQSLPLPFITDVKWPLRLALRSMLQPPQSDRSRPVRPLRLPHPPRPAAPQPACASAPATAHRSSAGARVSQRIQARCVPSVKYTGIFSLRAVTAKPPTWSECSCVMRIASSTSPAPRRPTASAERSPAAQPAIHQNPRPAARDNRRAVAL